MNHNEMQMIPFAWQDMDRQFRHFQLLFVAVKVGIPDALADGPAAVPELAEELRKDPVRLHRILRGLVWCGALDADEQGRYFLTEAGRFLLTEHPARFAEGIRWQGEFFFRAWGHLDDYLLTGATPFVQAYNGTPLFDLLASDAALSDLFNAPMTAHSARYAAAIANHPALDTARTLVDVGGGEGQLITDLLKIHSETTGIVFDLPGLAAAARTLLGGVAARNRCQFVGGDMFVRVPSGSDVYLLKWVLHDWDDARAAIILRRIGEAMHVGSRLLVIERLMPEKVTAANATLVQADLNMLCQNGGAERTLAEYTTLFMQAGLRLTSTQPLDTHFGFSILDATRMDATS